MRLTKEKKNKKEPSRETGNCATDGFIVISIISDPY